ncbi:hypothetical protein M885DRAFT_515189 [Pelagophyceae sp. CCMP2097]|nr:hypothetical protein M885DRAFT_515189 [Pelagophyceae sp. CCMP2097]
MAGAMAIQGAYAPLPADEGGNAKPFELSPAHRAAYGCALAWCNGFINANTFLRFGLFGGFMTGNSITLGTALVAPVDAAKAGVAAAAILAFLVGSAAGFFADAPGRRRRGSFQVLALALVVVAACGEAALPVIGRYAVLPLCGVMGAIDVINLKGIVKVRLAYMTGGLQKIVSAAVVCACGRGTPEERRAAYAEARELARFFTAFVLGANFGAQAVKKLWTSHQYTCLPTVALAAAFIAFHERPPNGAHFTLGV